MWLQARAPLAAGLAVAALVAAPGPAFAGHALRRAARPPHGTPATRSFSVHYYARGESGFIYDAVYLRGPHGTPCDRILAKGLGVPYYRLGAVTFALGPKRPERWRGNTANLPVYAHGITPLKRWCPGYYRGVIERTDARYGRISTLLRFWFVVR